MSFLDNLKKISEETGAVPVTKPNPLATKPNPLAAKANPLAPKANPLEPKKSLTLPKKELPVEAKPNPFGLKKTIAPAVVVETSESEETEDDGFLAAADAAMEASGLHTAEADLPKKEENEVEAEIEEVETEVPVETESEAPEETETPVEEEKSIMEDLKEQEAQNIAAAAVKEVREAAAPAKKATSRKKTTTAKESICIDEFEMPTTSCSYGEAMSSVVSPFTDEEWELYRTEIQEGIDAVNIDADINPATLRNVVGKLSSLRTKVWFNYQAIRSQYETLSSKEPEGLIERVKRTNLGDATNDMQRKKAGIDACMSYVDRNGNTINLYELMEETRSRYNFLRAVMDSIEYKRSVLVTMTGALKIEKELGPNAD